MYKISSPLEVWVGFFPPIIKQLRGAEGMAYQLRSLTALSEDLGLIPGTPNCS